MATVTSIQEGLFRRIYSILDEMDIIIGEMDTNVGILEEMENENALSLVKEEKEKA